MFRNYVEAKSLWDARYIIGRLVNDDKKKVVGEYVWNMLDDYVVFVANGRKQRCDDGLDVFECNMWERFGATVEPDKQVLSVVW